VRPPYEEASVLPPGVVADGVTRGPWVQNMVWRDGAWHTRKGLGQLAEFDTTLSRNDSTSSTSEWGYMEHLGSHELARPNGRSLLVSVLRAKGYTGTADQSVWHDLLVVSIFDPDTRTRWEEPVPIPTSAADPAVTDYDLVFGAHDHARDRQHESWVRPTGDRDLWFHQFGQHLFFGAPGAGIFCVEPITVRKTRRMHLHDEVYHEFGFGYSESAAVTKVRLTPGLFIDTFAYMRDEELGQPIGMCTWRGRAVLATQELVVFSDVGNPMSFAADNLIAWPGAKPLVAISEHRDVIVLRSEDEVWLYRPSVGKLASQGALNKVNDGIGCYGQHLSCHAGQTLVWVDRHGVWGLGEGGVEHLSPGLDAFFEGGASSPITSFYAESGHTSINRPQPQTVLQLDPDRATITYSPFEDLLVITSSKGGFSLVRSEGAWSTWVYESVVETAGGAVGVRANQSLPNPWLTRCGDRLLAVCGPSTYTLTDAAEERGVPVLDSFTSRSVFVCEYGRGGGVDRSVDDEDDRLGSGKWQVDSSGANDGGYYIGEPVKVAPGYLYASGGAAGAADYWVPVQVQAKSIADVTDLSLHVYFDNSQWVPIFHDGVTAEIDFHLPPERMASVLGWGAFGAMAAGTQVRCTDGFGAPDRTGDEIHMDWTGFAGTWDHQPHMNLTSDRRDMLLYLPMRRLDVTTELSGMAWGRVLSTVTSAGPPPVTNNCDVWHWEHFFWGDSINGQDNVAQVVDWALKSDRIGTENTMRILPRGLALRLLSRGTADDQLRTGWIYGLLNSALALDGRAWHGQVMDHVTRGMYQEVRDKGTLRDRVTTAAGALVQRVFGGSLVWGDPADGTVGTYLVDDEEVGDIVTSVGGRAKTTEHLLFGHIGNRAERVVVEGMKLLYRPLGGTRRRTGR
jgi:hypothetical protein